MHTDIYYFDYKYGGILDRLWLGEMKLAGVMSFVFTLLLPVNIQKFINMTDDCQTTQR